MLREVQLVVLVAPVAENLLGLDDFSSDTVTVYKVVFAMARLDEFSSNTEL